MKTLRPLLAGAIAAAAMLSSTSAAAAFIGFEEFGNVGTSGPFVTNQYAADGVVFSSAGAGEGNQVSSQAGLADGIDFICTGNGNIDCTGETILTFASGVSGLTFLAIGSNAPGVQAQVDIYVNNLLAATQGIVVGGAPNTPDLVDLSAWSDVTSIRIHDITDPAGLGWDDFSFKASAVPEPGSLGLLLAGLGALAFARRQQRC